jgi:hypothetical protein
MKFKIAMGTDPGKVQTRELSWDKIATHLTTHNATGDKKQGAYFVGGAFKSAERVESNMLCRSMLTLDLDNPSITLAEIEFELAMHIDGAFAAYSTYRHTPESPRLRVIVPLAREITPNEYREFSRTFASRFTFKVDPCSFTPNEYMYLPRCPDLAQAWTMRQDGEPLAVPDEILPTSQVEGDLEDALAAQPLDLSLDEIDAYLKAYDPAVLEYDEWLTVGAALHHQFKACEIEGFARWLRWSERSSKHDPKEMLKKWRSFGNHPRRATFASVIFKVRESGASPQSPVAPQAVEAAAFEALADDAASVDTLDSYDAIKGRIQAIGEAALPRDKRAMLASEIYEAWGKEQGLTKTEIKRELAPTKSKGALPVNMTMPAWLKGWVYVEKTCEFYHSQLHYGIKREAFDAKFSREQDCILAEMPASRFALNACPIPTVVDLMFWPGAGEVFTHEGMAMLNSYKPHTLEICDQIDDDGQAVVDLFMDHVRFIIEDKAEQRILIDFLAWVIQNPGHKINWALMLQGAQGVGKSYFGFVMGEVLGHMVRQIEPSALSGRFTSWAHGALLLVVEEIRMVGENRYEIIDRLKPFITNPMIQIEEKGRDHRTVPNFSSYLLFTNYKDALPIGQGDRRYAPIFSRVQSEEQLFHEKGGKEGSEDYFSKLFNETSRRPDAIARFLLDWQISDTFKAKGRAPHTKARDQMMALAVSDNRSTLDDLLDKHACEVIGDKVIDVTWLNKLCEGEGDLMPKTRAMSAILLEMGYEPIEGRRIKIKKPEASGLHYIWHRDCTSEQAAETVRAFFDGAPNYEPCPF